MARRSLGSAAAAVHLEGAVEVADVEAVAVELALEGGVAALRLAVDDLEHVVQSEVRLRGEEEGRGVWVIGDDTKDHPEYASDPSILTETGYREGCELGGVASAACWGTELPRAG